jgi:RNA polymerase sigma factor (sigma-70 family)
MPNPIDQFPKERLTPQREAELAASIAGGDDDALNELVLANMREALLYTDRACWGKIDVSHRISLCYQEMRMSARRFVPGRNRYFAFAKPGLRGRMKSYWNSLHAVRNSTEEVSTNLLDEAGQSKRYQSNQCPEDDHENSFRERVTGEVEMPDLSPMLARDHWESIRRALADRLSEQQWMILDLTYKGGLNFPEIGRMLNLTRSAIHAAHRKAIHKLRDGVAENKGLFL